MAAVPFDTLKFARHLEASGLPAAAAAGASEALADALIGADLATKADIADTRTQIAGSRTELKTEITALRTEVKTEITALRTELKMEISALGRELRSDIEPVRRDVTIKFGGMLVIAVGILLTAIRYLPSHP